TALGVISGPLYLFIHNAPQAYAVGAVVGIIAGLFNTAALDLLMRSCPDGPEGVAMTFGTGVVSAAYAGRDLLGSWLYQKGGLGGAAAVLLLAVAGQRDEPGAGEASVLPERLRNAVAVQVGKVDVEQHDVRLEVSRLHQRRLPVEGRARCVPPDDQ